MAGPEEVHIDNPAGRLLRFLRKARGLGHALGVQVGGQLHCLFPFAKSPTDLLTFLKQVDIYLDLLDEAKRQLEICDRSHLGMFLRAEPNLKGFANIVPLQQQWSEFREKYIREADLVALEVASITLHRFFPEKMIDAREIDDLKGRLSQIYDEAQKANLEFGLKRMLLKSLEELIYALLDYELTGSSHLDDAVGGIIGRAMMHQTFAITAVQKTSSEAGPPDDQARIAGKFWTILEDISKDLEASESLSTFKEALKLVKGRQITLPMPEIER